MSKVRNVEFRDYKAFGKFTLSARDRNVLVGPNNAGKSTTLDAFRIAFDVLRFAGHRNPIFKTQGELGVCSTWAVPVSAVQSDLRACIHDFGDGPARIVIKLDNGNSFHMSIPSGGDIECFLDADGVARKSASFLKEKFPLKLVIVPTLSPLEQNEELVLRETVERNRYGRLASRNFRNFWLHRTRDEFEAFADLVEFGWPGIRIRQPEIERSDDSKPMVRMYFRDGSKVREVQWAGFGFQVWMQTVMHLSGADKGSTLVLDEPDVYLHPDLQHRLLHLIGDRVGQFFIATHSTEIINDAEPGEVLIVRPEARGAKRIQGEADYTNVYAAIGSSENAQFARLAKTKKVLYFEGQDARILSRIAKKLLGVDFISRGGVTLMKTDGFANWHRVSTSSWVFENFFGFRIPVAAIFDRDYRCDEEVETFLSSINTSDTQCRVLPVKELENILLVPRAVQAVVEKNTRGELPENVGQEIQGIFDSCYEAVKTRTLSSRIGERLRYELAKGGKGDILTTSVAEERTFAAAWPMNDFKRKVVPGKTVFSEITGKIQQRYTVTLTPARVVDELKSEEIDPSVLSILESLKAHLGE